MRYTLGVNCGDHDSSAALLRDGGLVVMVEQERVSRHKHAFGEPPVEAIVACLEFAGITLDDIEVLAVGWDLPRFAATRRYTFDKAQFVRRIIPPDKIPRTRDPRLVFVPHHVAHAASAFWTSGFDAAAALVIDGRGEETATTIAQCSPAGIALLAEWDINESLGNLYATAAEWAGLSFWGTGKFMGLASYGQPNQPLPIEVTPDGYHLTGTRPPHPRLGRRKLQQRVLLHRHFRSSNDPSTPAPAPDAVMDYADFAASVQGAVEEAVLNLARVAREKTGLDRLVLSGGVALNCTLNGRLVRSGIFNDIYIPPVPHDAGVSLGAALMVSRTEAKLEECPERLRHAYWGPEESPSGIAAALRRANLHAVQLDDAPLSARVARALADGQVVGWFQGRAEIGQRALGARSILCDPRDPRMLGYVNALKGREAWRPLAPSVLEEYVDTLFGPVAAADFMLTAWPASDGARRMLPAAVHVDGSARPQVVRRTTHPRFWALIEEFRRLTGVPAVVNTSFNLAGEPVVLTAADAISVMCRSRLDLLVLDRFVVARNPVPHIA